MEQLERRKLLDVFKYGVRRDSKTTSLFKKNYSSSPYSDRDGDLPDLSDLSPVFNEDGFEDDKLMMRMNHLTLIF